MTELLYQPCCCFFDSAQNPFVSWSFPLRAHPGKLPAMEGGGGEERHKAKEMGKCSTNSFSPVRFSSFFSKALFASSMDGSDWKKNLHNCPCSFSISRRVQVTEVVSPRNRMFALLIRLRCFDWISGEYPRLLSMCHVRLLLVHQFWGDSVAAACVRHHVSPCPLSLPVTLPAVLIKNLISTKKLSAAVFVAVTLG